MEEIKQATEEEIFRNHVVTFAVLDAEQKKLKKESDPLKDRIKKYMGDNDLDTFKEGPVTAKYQIQERKSMNEPMLVNKLKALGLDDAIKTVEVPDQAAIEELIYAGELDPADLDECVIRKNVTVLKVTGGDKLGES